MAGTAAQALDDDEPEDLVPEPRAASSEPRQILANLLKNVDEVNIATSIDDQALMTLGQQVVSEFQIDVTSRADWRDEIDRALDIATQTAQPKQFPWNNASNVIYPLITSAALQFQARTYPALIQNRNVVKGVVWGSDKGTPARVDGKPDGQVMTDPQTQQPVWVVAPGEKRQRADRIGDHMSYQLLEEMSDWEEQTDTMLGVVPIEGGFVRKIFYNPVEKINCSQAIRITELVWNYHAASFKGAPRHTEIVRLYPTEIEELERSGLFIPRVYGPGSDISDDGQPEQNPSQGNDPDAPHIFLEQHRRYDLDGDGYAEPYVVTVHQRSAQVVRITARYDADSIIMGPDGVIRITPIHHYVLYPFLPNPKSCSHPLGWGHVAKHLNETISTAINQMIDAGTLQNAGGGFIGTGLSLHSGNIAFQVGRYVPVNNKGQDIRNSVYPIPWPGPSQVLMALVELLMGAAKEVTGTQDILSGDIAKANTSPTTVLALIEQGSKMYTSIHKRIYRAMKDELDKLYALNRKHLDEKRPSRYRKGDEWLEVTQEDYRLGGGVEPIADPTMVTDMQRLGRASVLMQMANDPMINGMEVRRRYLEYVGVDRIDEILVPPNPLPAQLALAEKQAELSEMRAAAQKNVAQSLLFMAQARSQATGPEIELLEKLLAMTRLHLEALNTQVKAADVQVKAHKAHTDASQMRETKANAGQTADDLGAAAASGNQSPGLGAMAPTPALPDLSGIPGGGGPGLPGQGGF